jgi:hypothetical protein
MLAYADVCCCMLVGGACARRSGVEQRGCAAAHRAVRRRAGTAIYVSCYNIFVLL